MYDTTLSPHTAPKIEVTNIKTIVVRRIPLCIRELNWCFGLPCFELDIDIILHISDIPAPVCGLLPNTGTSTGAYPLVLITLKHPSAGDISAPGFPFQLSVPGFG